MISRFFLIRHGEIGLAIYCIKIHPSGCKWPKRMALSLLIHRWASWGRCRHKKRPITYSFLGQEAKNEWLLEARPQQRQMLLLPAIANLTEYPKSWHLRVIQTACPMANALDIPISMEYGLSETNATLAHDVLPSPQERRLAALLSKHWHVVSILWLIFSRLLMSQNWTCLQSPR